MMSDHAILQNFELLQIECFFIIQGSPRTELYDSSFHMIIQDERDSLNKSIESALKPLMNIV